MKTYLRKGAGGLPDRFLVIYAKTTVKRSEWIEQLLVFAASREEPAPTPSSKIIAMGMPCILQWFSMGFNNLMKI